MNKRLLKLKWILSLILVLGSFSFQDPPKLEDADTTSIIKAAYIYNFAKLIDWPSENKSGNFIIGVYGNSNVYAELIKKYSSKRIGTQDIEIKKLSESPQVGNVHVLFISQSSVGDLDAILDNIGVDPVLVITESEGTLGKGAVINFLVSNNNLKFELNLKEANNRQLIVGSRLKDLAFKVEG